MFVLVLSQRRLLFGLGLCWFFLSCLCLNACTSQTRAKDPTLTYTVFSLRKLTCEGCGARVIRVLKQRKGVKQLRFDKHKVELTVGYRPKQVTAQAVREAIQGLGFLALDGTGKGAYLPPPAYPSHLDVKWIAKKGERVTLSQHVVRGKVTIFDFYADWCGPCKDVDHALLRLMKRYKHIALRKINVVDWDRPVAQQHLSDSGKLPYLILFDKQGKRKVSLAGRQIEALNKKVQMLHADP